jgi:hypothetical protein
MQTNKQKFMGFIGYDDFEGEQWPYGYQDYEGDNYGDNYGEQWPYGAQKQVVQKVKIPARPPVPQQAAPPEREPFTITPGGQGGAPAALTVNTTTVLSTIFTFTIPAGLKFEFNPADKEQEVLFTPFSSTTYADGNFILGELDVLLRTATGGRQMRVHHSHTLWHRPGSNIASIGKMRQWHHYAVGTPGDQVIFRFQAVGVLVAAGSALAARVRVQEI